MRGRDHYERMNELDDAAEFYLTAIAAVWEDELGRINNIRMKSEQIRSA